MLSYQTACPNWASSCSLVGTVVFYATRANHTNHVAMALEAQAKPTAELDDRIRHPGLAPSQTRSMTGCWRFACAESSRLAQAGSRKSSRPGRNQSRLLNSQTAGTRKTRPKAAITATSVAMGCSRMASIKVAGMISRSATWRSGSTP